METFFPLPCQMVLRWYISLWFIECVQPRVFPKYVLTFTISPAQFNTGSKIQLNAENKLDHLGKISWFIECVQL